ncbi:hypothetical protein BGZ46_010792 [Entomortierella lignicola]|nr:hypothetical protein BGZ46_010792 [Entomortierella lignicola]
MTVVKMRPLSLAVMLVTTGSLYLSCLSQVDAHLNSDGGGDAQVAWRGPTDRTADILAGSLEYSWSSSKPSVVSTLGSGRLESPESFFDTLELSFDTHADRSHLGASFAGKSLRPSNGNGEMYDCTVHVDSAIDTSFALSDEITKAISSNPDLAQILNPLSKIIVMPSQGDSRQGTTMRSMEMGLVAFHHIVQYIPGRVSQSLLTGVISQVEILRQKTADVVECEDHASYFDLSPSLSRPSCQAVQVFYDDYFSQVKDKIETQLKASSTNKPLFEDTLNSLQFQTAGAYLTQQGADEAVRQLEESDSSKEAKSLAESARLAIGAGDALQACQASIQKGAVQQQTSSTSVSSFEQLIYSHLGMSAKRKDPTVLVDSAASNDIQDSCQNLLEEAIKDVKLTRENAEALKGESGSKITGTIFSRYMDMLEARLQKSLEDRPDVELGQLEMALSIYIRTIKDMPPWEAFELMKKSLNQIQELEGGVHTLYSCVLAKAPSKHLPELQGPDSLGKQAQTKENMSCDFLAESYRDSLSQSLKQLESVSMNDTEDKDTVAFLQKNFQGMAEAANSWDKVGGTTAIGETEDSKKAVFQTISVRSHSVQSEEVKELSELMPFMIAQANSLEACSKVWQATHMRGASRIVRRATYDRRSIDDEVDEEDEESGDGEKIDKDEDSGDDEEIDEDEDSDDDEEIDEDEDDDDDYEDEDGEDDYEEDIDDDEEDNDDYGEDVDEFEEDIDEDDSE